MEKQVLTAKAVFDHAHEITARAERMAYVDQACADAPDLREKVVALLLAYDEAGVLSIFRGRPSHQLPVIPPPRAQARVSGHISCCSKSARAAWEGAAGNELFARKGHDALGGGRPSQSPRRIRKIRGLSTISPGNG